MIFLNDETTVIGTTELRKEIPSLTKNIKIKTIIVMKRGKPVAVLEDFEQFREKEKLLETFEDLVLGSIAKERDRAVKESKFIPAEKVMKRIGMRKKK